MSETIHKELAVKIVDKVKNIVTKGLYNIYELGVETYPYIYELCEAYGSGILMQITYDLFDSDILTREEYLQWKNNLNTKSDLMCGNVGNQNKKITFDFHNWLNQLRKFFKQQL